MAEDMEIFAKFSARGYENPKLMTLALDHPSAYRVWTWAIMYAVRNLTDGFVPMIVAKATLVAKKKDLQILEESGFFDPVDGGWMIHDFLEAQGRSRADVEEARAKRAEAARKAAEARWGKQSEDADPEPAAPVEPHATGNATAMRPACDAQCDAQCDADAILCTDTDTDTDTDNILPQTPSVPEGAEDDEEIIKTNLTSVPRSISYEQAQSIVERVRGFYPELKFRGRSYPQLLVQCSAAIVRTAGDVPDVAAWFVDRCRAYVDAQSSPQYVTDFATYVKGGGRADRRPYYEIDWGSVPKPKSPEDEKRERERERNLRDIDYICSHWRDEECQRAALTLSDAQQAAARAKYPDEWHKVWRRGQELADNERRLAAESLWREAS